MTTVKGDRRQWELGEQLDSGGFGEVFHARSDDEDAVVKLVPKGPGAEREFLFADDLSGVRNVIPLLDKGETEDRWALVMPRADKSLRRHLSERAGRGLDLADALPIMIDIAEALVDLAGKEVVHRDLKPENVLLLNGRWCLTDFGISRYAEATTAEDTRKFFMSRPYAAPEQWRFERATSATDVYALGVIGHELLSGARPFPGPDFRDQHLVGQPPALTTVPAPLAALLDQCLSKAPGSRPTPADLLSRLQRQASAAPVTGGLAVLQEAHRAEVARLSEEARRASEAETEAERRSALLQDAWRQLRSITITLREAILSAAPAANESGLVADHFSSGERTSGWRLRLSSAKLDFAPPSSIDPGSPLPFDVIAECVVRVSKPRDRYGYEGRSHSLWFCDAKEPGQYRWYETAFMDQPLMRKEARSTAPLAAHPNSAEAREALQPGIGVQQVAWPFTSVDPGEMDEFVSRWAGWFAMASTGQLTYPSVMPERPVDGSWRRN